MKIKLIIGIFFPIYVSVHANIWDDIKRDTTKAWKQATSKKTWQDAGEAIETTAEKIGSDIKSKAIDPAQQGLETAGKAIQKDVVDPIRKSSLDTERKLARTFGIKVSRYNFVVLNATPIAMHLELEKLDVLLLTTGATSVGATLVTATLPKNVEKHTLNAFSKPIVFHTPDKSFCWKYAQATYTNKSGRIVVLPLKKDHIAKCENFYAAIITKKDAQGNPLKDFEGNYIIEVKRGDEAKEYIKNYKPEAAHKLKVTIDKVK